MYDIDPELFHYIRTTTMSRAHDIDLIMAAQKGDIQAFDELVEIHRASMYQAALKMLRDHHSAEDAVQTALLSAWENVHQFKVRNTGSVGGWLRSKVTGYAKNIQVNSYTQPVYMDIRDDATYYRDDSENPAEQAAVTQATQHIGKTVAQFILDLPLGMQEVAIRFFLVENTPDEIATELGISRNAVYLRLSKARKKLQKDIRQAKSNVLLQEFLEKLGD